MQRTPTTEVNRCLTQPEQLATTLLNRTLSIRLPAEVSSATNKDAEAETTTPQWTDLTSVMMLIQYNHCKLTDRIQQKQQQVHAHTWSMLQMHAQQQKEHRECVAAAMGQSTDAASGQEAWYRGMLTK
jgi:hypothetical protein